MKNKVAMVLLGVFFAVLSATASARDNVRFSVSIGVPGYVYDAPPAYYPPPRLVYYAPPAPVYYAPPPVVYYAPAPWGHRGHGYGHGHRHGHGHGHR